MPRIHCIGGPNAGDRMMAGPPAPVILFGAEGGKYWRHGVTEDGRTRYKHDDLHAFPILDVREEVREDA